MKSEHFFKRVEVFYVAFTSGVGKLCAIAGRMNCILSLANRRIN